MPSYLLRSDALQESERWLAEAAAKPDALPRPTPLQSEYVVASQAAGRLETRQRLGVASILVVGFALLAVYSLLQKRNAERRERTAFSQALASRSRDTLTTQPDWAHLLAVEAVRSDETIEASGALLSALLDRPYLDGFLHVCSDDGARYVASLAFTKEGKILIAGSADGAIRRWDLADRQPLDPPLREPHPHNGVSQIAVSPGGEFLAAALRDGTVLLWNARTWEALAPLHTAVPREEAPYPSVDALAFHPDGRILAAGGYDGRITLWDVKNATLLRPAFGDPIDPEANAHRIGVQALTFSLDGRFLASGHGEDVTRPQNGGAVFRVWDAESDFQEREILPTGGTGARGVGFSADGQQLYWGRQGGTIDVYDVVEQRALPPLTGGPTARTTSLDVASRGLLVSSHLDGSVVLWDLRTRQLWTDPWPAESRYAEAVRFAPAGDLLAAGGADGLVSLWKMDAPLLGRTLETNGAAKTLLTASEDGRWLAGADSVGHVRRWDLSTGKSVGVFDLVGQPSIATLGIDGDDVLVLHHDDTVQRCDAKGCGEVKLQHPAGPGEYAKKLPTALSGESRESASLRRAGQIKWGQQTKGVVTPDGSVWAVPTSGGLELCRRDGCATIDLGLGGGSEWVGGMAISRDGSVVAVGIGDGRIFFCDAATAATTCAAVEAHRGGVVALAFRRDGAWLASGSRDGTVVLWDVEKRQVIGRSLPERSRLSQVFGVAFSGDGRELAVSYTDPASVVLWSVELEDWVERACARANRNLSLDEWRHDMGDRPCRATCDIEPACLDWLSRPPAPF